MDQYQEEYEKNPENENMNQTYGSDKARRNYPKYIKGQKSEWIGLVQHHIEINDEIGKIEKDIKNLKAKTLHSEYEKNLIALYEKKRQNLLIKQKEAQEAIEKQKLYHESLMQSKQDKIIMQNHLTEVYDQLVKEKQSALNKNKMEDRAIENAILEDNFRKIEQKQKELMNKKEREKAIALAEMNEKSAYKKLENLNKRMSIEEIKEMNKMNEMKQHIKEENYKNFYKICSENQEIYQDLHRSHVLNPYLEKQRKIQDMINKNFDEENKKKFQQEIDRLKKKQNENMFSKNFNEMQIMEHNKLKELEKIEKKIETEARLKDLNEYNNFLNYKKNQKVQKMNEYKERLDNQFDEKKNIQMNGLRMTRNEKALNYNDLQAFKDIDPSLYAMIPGWSPQIGGLKIPKSEMSQILNYSESQPQVTKPTQFSPNKFPAKKIVQPLANENQNLKSMANEQFGNKSRANLELNVNKTPSYGSNPLFNPTPNYLQNPYIAKEFTQRKNVLSQMGQNSLF